MRKERRYLLGKDLYKEWAKDYDTESNLIFFLEEKETKKLFNLKNKKILDLGCGTGRYSIQLAKNNDVVAVDFSKEMIELAEKKAEKNNVQIEIYNEDINKFRLKKKFDVIISMLVLDHIKNLNNVIKNIDLMSKKGTKLFISNVPPYQVYRRINNFKNRKINQEYHPLEEYLKLLRKKDFELVNLKEFIFEEKYKRMERFKEFRNQLNEPVAILMEFVKTK